MQELESSSRSDSLTNVETHVELHLDVEIRIDPNLTVPQDKNNRVSQFSFPHGASSPPATIAASHTGETEQSWKSTWGPSVS